jgi:26S proteasome regulatory subunit T1
MATNRAESLDPALMRPGRVDRVIEFGLPDFAGRCAIFRAAAGRVANEPGVRLELLARLCRGCTGADIACVVREAGMFAIRRRKKGVGEGEYLSAVEKVVTGTEAKRFLGAAAQARAAGAYAL